MTFANLPIAAVLAGLAGLAALLFLLQRLRIRHTVVTVPTVLFWRAAARDAPVRVLRERFRHWLAYLLFLAICALLWFGFAAPESQPDGARHHVLFLDGSAHAASGDDFARAVAALETDLRTLPTERREVVWGGVHNVKLLAAGEDHLLLDRRLADLAPEAAPSALRDQLRLVSIPNGWPEQVEFVVYGRAPVDAAALAGVRPGVRVSRGLEYPAPAPNQGIVALGLAGATSDEWERVDALVRVAASERTAQLDAPLVRLDDQPWPGAPERVGGSLLLRDLPAKGQLLTVELPAADALTLDDQAHVRLPQRRLLGVAVAPGVPSVIGEAIDADPGLRRAADDAAVAVRFAGTDFGGELPALELVPMAAQEAAFHVVYAAGEGAADAGRRLGHAVALLGLDQIDATGLATALQRPVTLAVESGERPAVSLWAALLDEGFNFTADRGFPLFLARTLRHLAGERAWPRFLAAGTPVQDGAAGWSSDATPALDAVGARYVPAPGNPRQGDWAVSLLSEEVTAREAGAALPLYQRGGAGTTAAGIATWIALAAIALLALEWALFRRGLVP